MRSDQVTRARRHAAGAGGQLLALLAGYVHTPAGLGLDQALGAELADGALDCAVGDPVALHEGPLGGNRPTGLKLAVSDLSAENRGKLQVDGLLALVIYLHTAKLRRL